MGLRNIFIYPVEALNAIKTNVWAVVLIGVGSALTLHGHSDIGSSLATGGFAILRSESATGAPPNPTPQKDPEKQ